MATLLSGVRPSGLAISFGCGVVKVLRLCLVDLINYLFQYVRIQKCSKVDERNSLGKPQKIKCSTF